MSESYKYLKDKEFVQTNHITQSLLGFEKNAETFYK